MMELGLERGKKSKNELKLNEFPSTQQTKSLYFERLDIMDSRKRRVGVTETNIHCYKTVENSEFKRF